ncbi:MAG: hypothetical protein K5659_08790 [Lachnospiraceae bacterium]|nr:hypothetical protein [Lachnospiraceae bacterium]
MKIKALLVVSALVLGMAFVGCSNPAEDAADGVENMYQNEEKAEDAVDGIKEDGEEKDAEFQEILDSSNKYIFEYDGLTLAPDMNSQEFLNVLGEANHYYEVKSCAFEGLDKIYTYSSFEIYTYPNGSDDLISNIFLKDDTVTTKEGVYIGMSLDTAKEKIGEEGVLESGVCTFDGGGDRLRLYVDGSNTITSIEYQSKVLDQE